MNIILTVLSITSIAVFYWALIGNNNQELSEESILNNSPTKLPSSREIINMPPVVAEKKAVINPQRQYRRAQQYLTRQRELLFSNMKEMHHQSQVLDISAQLNTLHAQQTLLQDRAVTLKGKEIEVTTLKADQELSNREGLLTINEAKNQLERSTIDSYKLKAENELDGKLLDIQQANIQLNESAQDLNQTKRFLELHEKELGITSQELNLSRETIRQKLNELKIEKAVNNLEFQDHVNRLNAIEVNLQKVSLNNEKGALQNSLGNIENKRQQLELKVTEGLQALQGKELDNRKGEIQNLLGALNNKEVSIQNAEKSLKLSYAMASEKFRVLLNNIVFEGKNLRLERKSNALYSKEERLQIFENKLHSLQHYINQMFEIKSNWLRIGAKENQIGYREQKHRLDATYQNTQRDLNRLRVERKENNLVHREKKLEMNQFALAMQRRWDW